MRALRFARGEPGARSGLGDAVSAAADLGRSGVLTQGRAHMTWHVSRQVLTGLCHVSLVRLALCLPLGDYRMRLV